MRNPDKTISEKPKTLDPIEASDSSTRRQGSGNSDESNLTNEKTLVPDDMTEAHFHTTTPDHIKDQSLSPSDEMHGKKPQSRYSRLHKHFPTFFTALPRLPFALVPFAFSQFILIEALSHQGWIEVFATWLVRASHREIHPTIWLVGVIGVIMCNIAGTNIGATILLTKVVRAADMPPHSLRAAAIALAVASNIGAVSFTFSASLAGLLWKNILGQKGINIRQFTFAKWNLLPLLAMTAVGLSIVSAEMAVLYHGSKF